MPTAVAPPADSRTERIAVAVAVAGSAVIFWRGLFDPFAAPKLTVVALAVLAIAVLSLHRVLETGRVAIPWNPVAAAVAAFVALGFVTVLTSPAWYRSLVGQQGRGTGWGMYLAAAIVFVAVLRSVRDEREATPIVHAAALAGVVVAAYGVLQRIGADPFSWTGDSGPRTPFSTLGNVNFSSGYVAATLPLVAWRALTARSARDRLLAAGALVGMLGAVGLMQSAQGVVAGAAGLTVFGIAVILERTSGVRRRCLLAAIVGAAVLGISLAIAGLAGAGPLSSFDDVGFELRRDYWEASASMIAEHPVLGVGFDMWGGHYRAHRSEDAAIFANVTDEPHSVPLAMLSSGGLVLGIAYLAVVALTLLVLLRGLQRSTGERRLLLGAVGGAWVGYQIQSAVSIDVPAFPPLHFALAGLIVALAGSVGWREREIPGLVVERRYTARKRSRPGRTSSRLAGAPATAIALVVALVGAWQLTRPARADAAAQAGLDRLASGDARSALEGLFDAQRLVPWEPTYSSTIGGVFAQAGNPELALAAYERAVSIDPRRFADTLNAARTAAAAEDVVKASALFDRALELEPHAPELKIEAADAFRRGGDAARAIDLAAEALEVDPDNAEWHLTLAQALADGGDPTAAVEEFRTASELWPNEGPALLRLSARLREAGQPELAVEAAERVYAVAPDTVAVILELALALEGVGDVERALELYDSIADVDSGAAARAAALRGAEG